MRTPVSAIRAPRSRLALRLAVIAALPFSPTQYILSALVRRARCIDVLGLSEGRRGDVPLNVSTGDTEKSRPLRGMGLGMLKGSVIVSRPGERTGPPTDGGSPNEDATEGGGTDGYVNSKARGSVAGPPGSEPSEPGVVALVALLGPTSGENMGGEEKEAEEDDGGVMDGLAGAWDGRWIWEGGRGIGTRAECVIDGDWRVTPGDEDTEGRRCSGWDNGSPDEDDRPMRSSTGRPSCQHVS
jgi:hypothetical protein